MLEWVLCMIILAVVTAIYFIDVRRLKQEYDEKLEYFESNYRDMETYCINLELELKKVKEQR